ncbi:MAG: hypothetical protein WD469_13775 [Paenibacillaceae bacterium]
MLFLEVLLNAYDRLEAAEYSAKAIIFGALDGPGIRLPIIRARLYDVISILPKSRLLGYNDRERGCGGRYS